MNEALRHPKSRELLRHLAQWFRSKDFRTYVVRDSDIVFLCGGEANADNMRSRFYEYARNRFPEFRIFLAEKAFDDYRRYTQSQIGNLTEFEDAIAEISTCVVLFPESPGSFAELGHFAKSENVRKKILLVNDSEFQGRDSFLSLGPIRQIDAKSKFKPTIQIQRTATEFPAVRQRLENRAVLRVRRSRFVTERYKDLTLKDKIFVIFEIIRIFQAVTFDGIVFAFKSIWQHASKKEIRLLLSILVASDYVSRRDVFDHSLVCVTQADQHFLHFERLDVGDLMLKAIDIYEQHFPEIAKIVRELRG